MSKLLLGLTVAIVSGSLSSCSVGDITVKTDLDESYIVKRTAVTDKPFDWEPARKRWEESVKSWSDSASLGKNSLADCISNASSDFCGSLWGPLNKLYQSQLARSTKNLADLKAIRAGETNPVQAIRYRPIFVDVNNERHAMGYVSVTCLNPDLTSKEAKKILEILEVKEDEVSKKKTARQDAYTTVSLEVCKKYAYPKANRFSYSIDEDQSKDKALK